MTRDMLQARLEELEKQLSQQERIQDAARIQMKTAKVAVRQIQGACAMLRELLSKEPAEAAPPGIGSNGPEGPV
jgi:hypothetical protein